MRWFLVRHSRALALALAAGCAGAQPTKLATGQFPFGIAVDDRYVYWVDTDSPGSVVKVSKSGGTPTTLASSHSPVSVALDANAVYWTDSGTTTCSSTGACISNADGAVMSVLLAGGTPTTLASGQHAPVSIAVDATNAYFVDEGTAVYDSTVMDGSVVKVSLAGGTPLTLATGLFYPGALAVDATSVYFTYPDPQGVNGFLMKVPIAGGAVVTLATGWPPWTRQTGGATVPKLIAADGTNVYWVAGDINGAGAKVMKISTAGGTVSTLGVVQSEFTTLALDASNLYWSEGRSFVKTALAGGSPTTFASGEGTLEPGGIAVDATTIFWTDYMGQAVMSASK